MQTEKDFIWPGLVGLGWFESRHQEDTAIAGRDDLPDRPLFADAAVKAAANIRGNQ